MMTRHCRGEGKAASVSLRDAMSSFSSQTFLRRLQGARGWGRDWDIVNADCYGLSLSLLTVELQMSMLFLMMLMIRQCCNETLCSRFERIVMNVSIVEFKIYLSMVKKKWTHCCKTMCLVRLKTQSITTNIQLFGFKVLSGSHFWAHSRLHYWQRMRANGPTPPQTDCKSNQATPTVSVVIPTVPTRGRYSSRK